MEQLSLGFSDRPALEHLVRALAILRFSPPKWEYRYDVPIRELAPCCRGRLLCDVVAYRDGQAAVVFEMDGGHHAEEVQQARDFRKELILLRHGIRLWRMWNPELGRIWGCRFEQLLEGQQDEIDQQFARLFRRGIKAHMYAPYGSLASDWTSHCSQCSEKEG